MLAWVLRWRARLSSSRVGVVLVYHRVGGETSGNEDLEILPAVGRDEFKRQLAHLRRHYRVVPAVEILPAIRARRRCSRFPVAITFDDDLPEHVREALPALTEAGLAATFFLTGAALEGPHAFWWEDLQRAVDTGSLNGLPHVDVGPTIARAPRAILDATGAIVRLSPSQREEVIVRLRDAVGPPPESSGLRTDEVQQLVEAGCTVGFHTRGHDVLPSLSDAELERALRDGRRELESVTGEPTTSIAYPHGKSDERVAEAARNAGFSLGFTTARGAATAETDPLLVPRTVADLSADALSLRLARLVAGA
jgi:peptidoglycan/xylan/chitin deacetylase (PgdA/CDA1 family)